MSPLCQDSEERKAAKSQVPNLTFRLHPAPGQDNEWYYKLHVCNLHIILTSDQHLQCSYPSQQYW